MLPLKPTTELPPLPHIERVSNRQLLGTIGRLSLPVLLTNLLQSLVGVIDVYMVGRLGPIEIAAAGLSNVIRILVLVMVLSVAAGAMSLVAQAKGARDEARMSLVTRQAISSGLLLAFSLTLIGLLITRPLLLFANSGGDPEAVRLGTRFLQIIFLGMPFLVLNIVFNRLMQGAGDTVTPLFLTLGLNVLNVGFNFLFMFGAGPIPAFGLAGAAIGTVISRALGVAIALYIIFSGRNVIKIGQGSFRPNPQLFRDIFAIGLPSGIQGVFRNGSRLLVFSLVTSTELGTLGAAALAIGFQVESLAFMPVLGINVAATSLVGQSLGSWQTEEARRRGTMAIGLGVLLMIVLVSPIIIFAPAIIQLFDPSANPILLAAGTSYLRINTPFLVFAAVAMVSNGALRGAGDTTPSMISTLATRGLISVGLAWLFAFPLGYGSNGIWAALAVGITLDGLILAARWRSGAWLQVALHKSAVYREHLHSLPEKIRQRFLRDVRSPLMAQPTTLELVEPSSVLYRLDKSDVRVDFKTASYSLSFDSVHK